MTKITDPIELYRAALDAAPTPAEEHPPVIERAEVWPYPDLRRLWVRVQTSPFATYPNLTFTVSDKDGQIVCTMFMVEIREPYQSVTLHLRQEPRPGDTYRLEIELEREETLLDQRILDFPLEFREPETKNQS